MPGGRTLQHTARNKAAFLAAFRRFGTIKHSAEAIGMDRGNHDRWLANDEEYAKEFTKANQDIADMLVQEAIHRAVEGDIDYVVSNGRLVYIQDPDDPGKKTPLVLRKKSDKMLELMLKARLPAEFRDRYNEPPPSSPVTVNITMGPTELLSRGEISEAEWRSHLRVLAVQSEAKLPRIIEGEVHEVPMPKPRPRPTQRPSANGRNGHNGLVEHPGAGDE